MAVCLLGLLAFSAFTIDNGVMLSSRRQAQNAADSGALAAALFMAWDDPSDAAGAEAMAEAAAAVHDIWGDGPDAGTVDVTFPPCPPGAPGPVDQCVRVDVFRNQARGNALPAFFASLAGVTEQGVRATATAQVVYGDSAQCLLPFAIPDKWNELREEEEVEPPIGSPDAIDNVALIYPFDELYDIPWDPTDDTYDVVETQGQQGGDPLGGEIDDYIPGPPFQGGTSYAVEIDHGMQIRLKSSNDNKIAPSNYYPVVLPDGLGNGAAAYRYRIRNCTELTIPEDYVFIAETGNMVGPTNTVQELVDADPLAWWDPTHPNPDGSFGRPVGGCMDAGTCDRSPRWRAVPTFDIENYMTGHRTGRGDIIVSGFVGMFLDNMIGGDVVAYLTLFDFDPTANNLTDNTSSFLRNVILVR